MPIESHQPNPTERPKTTPMEYCKFSGLGHVFEELHQLAFRTLNSQAQWEKIITY